MALRALLLAQIRSAWNRARREAGVVGPIATLAVLALITAILALPSLGMLWVGLHLGRDLATAQPASALLVETLTGWNAWMALGTVVFAFLGSFRHHPAFSRTELGRLPIPSTQLLLAEIPVGLLEVFPILGAAGLVCSHLGLAIRMPMFTPLIALLAVQSLMAMLALMLLLAALRRDLAQHRLWPLALLLILAPGAYFLNLAHLRWLLRDVIPAIIPWLPISQSYAGLVDLWIGQWLSGAGRLAFALASTLVLIAAAAWIHQRERSREQSAGGSQSGRAKPLHFTHPAVGVGRLFQKQLMDSKTGRTTLILPFLITLPVALVLGLVNALLKSDGVMTEQLTEIQRLSEFPLVGGLLFLIVIMNSQIWMNQFGWDQGGIRTFLLLPLSPRDLLLGKLVGLARYAGLQAVIGVLPLLLVYRPTVSEVLAGLAAASTGLVVTAAAGHLLSARFPRSVTHGKSASLPLYLAWVPTVIIVAILGLLLTLGLIAHALSPWALPAVYLVTLACIVLGYLRYLPPLSTEVHRQRERLLRM